jgi:chromosome segregation ATPase
MSDYKAPREQLLALAVLAIALALPGTAAPAQSGKIVCWKDKSGKVIGCGDTVPPEYQGSGTKELDSRGITRKQTESVEEANRRREKEQDITRSRADEDRKALDQKRQDTALLETYSSEREIDLKRDRDMQVIDLQIEQFTVALKNTTQRYNETKARADVVEKNKKPLPANLKEELARVGSDKQRFEQSIQAKQREKEELRNKYAEYRKRFAELRAQQQAAAPSRK